MKKQNIKTKSGFTIIEVVLVLAIAGLIFLMVFIALPALQRSQRDTQRRDDMARLATALTNWQTNHGNSLPGANEADSFLQNYLKQSTDLAASEFKDPNGTNYGLTIINGTGENPNLNVLAIPNIKLVTSAHCNGETAVHATTDGANDYAILYQLEGSGVLCQDSK